MSPPSCDRATLEAQFERFRVLGVEELRREWRRLWHSEPPRISHDLLVLGLGYRLQELEEGGLRKATKRKLQTMAKSLRTTGRIGLTPNVSLKPGSRLVRAWHGRTHRYRDGGRIRLFRHDLSVPDPDRQRDHRSALVGAAIFWVTSGECKAFKQR